MPFNIPSPQLKVQASISKDPKVRIDAGLKRINERALAQAFRESTFVYGTMGKGSNIVRGLKLWAGRARKSGELNAKGDIEKVIPRELNLFDPGRRAHVFLSGDHQMMDMYYGQAGNDIFKKRNPIIAEFVHYAMGYNTEFSAQQTGREAYMHNFKTKVEGWDKATPSKDIYGQTATMEISRIIRWGIQKFGGTLIFEGRELFYSQVFAANPPYFGDTDVEAKELFKYFVPHASRVGFGKGTVIFHWGGKEIVPTKYHFLTNWVWGGKDGDDRAFMHSKANVKEPSFAMQTGFLPIWNNFADLPQQLATVDKAKLLEYISKHGAFGV